MSVTAGVYAKVRGEIVALFGWSAESLSPDQTLRVDCAAAMRIGLDDLQGRVMRGELVDTAKMLTISEALARLLPPAVLATPPAEQRDDHDAAIAPLLKLFRYLHETVATLSAENAHLKALHSGGHVSALPSPRGGSTAISPTEADVVPPNEIGVASAGVVRGPDDPKPPVTIDGSAVPNPPAAPAAPKYDYSREQGWKDFVEPDGSIRTTPRGRGHYFGPV